MGEAGGAAAEAYPGRAGEVELDGDGPALDQPSQAAQLVEHAIERGQELRPVRVALRHRHRRGGRRPGERHEATHAQAHDRGRAGQELPSRQRRRRAHARSGHAETSRAQYTGTGGRWNSTPGATSVRPARRRRRGLHHEDPGVGPGIQEPRRHLASGVGHGVDERVQHPGPAVSARGVVELSGPRVEEPDPVAAVAHQELGVLGQEVGVRELLAGHREPTAAVLEDAEPGEPRVALVHPALLPSGRRDQGPSSFGERVELPREIPRGRSTVHVENGVQAVEGRLQGSALLEDAVETALPGEQVEHLERQELVGPAVGGHHPELSDREIARPGAVLPEEGEAAADPGPGFQGRSSPVQEVAAQVGVQRDHPPGPADLGVGDRLEVRRGRHGLAEVGRIEREPEDLRVHEGADEAHVPGVGVQPGRARGAGRGVGAGRQARARAGPDRAGDTQEVRGRAIAQAALAEAEDGSARHGLAGFGGDRLEARGLGGAGGALQVGPRPHPSDDGKPAAPCGGDQGSQGSLLALVSLGPLRPGDHEAVHRGARHELQGLRVAPALQRLGLASAEGLASLPAFDLQRAAGPSHGNLAVEVQG